MTPANIITRKPYAQSGALAVDTSTGDSSQGQAGSSSQGHTQTRNREAGPASTRGDTPIRSPKSQRFRFRYPGSHGQPLRPMEHSGPPWTASFLIETFHFLYRSIFRTTSHPQSNASSPNWTGLWGCATCGCHANNYTWRRSPRMANYAIRFHSLDAPMQNDLVGPAKAIAVATQSDLTRH